MRITDAHTMGAPSMEIPMSPAKSGKKAVNLSISADLLQAARESDINLSAALESALRDRLRQLRQRGWLEEHADAIQAYNREVEEHGTFSDGLRTF